MAGAYLRCVGDFYAAVVGAIRNVAQMEVFSAYGSSAEGLRLQETRHNREPQEIPYPTEIVSLVPTHPSCCSLSHVVRALFAATLAGPSSWVR